MSDLSDRDMKNIASIARTGAKVCELLYSRKPSLKKAAEFLRAFATECEREIRPPTIPEA